MSNRRQGGPLRLSRKEMILLKKEVVKKASHTSGTGGTSIYSYMIGKYLGYGCPNGKHYHVRRIAAVSVDLRSTILQPNAISRGGASGYFLRCSIA